MRIIALIGGVGVGKTYWGRQLYEKLSSCQFIEEDTSDNLYLKEFYMDMKKWGFHSRISMLSMIISNLQKIDSKREYIIIDRCVQELIVFAQKEFEEGNLTKKEFELYCQLYNGIIHLVPEPDVYIFFHCSPEISLSRIQMRARDCEMGVELDFCRDVIGRYDNWRKVLPDEKVIDLYTDSDIDLDDLARQIRKQVN